MKSLNPSAPPGARNRKAPVAPTSQSTKARLQAEMSAVAIKTAKKIGSEKAKAKAVTSTAVKSAVTDGQVTEDQIREALGRVLNADLSNLPDTGAIVKSLSAIANLEGAFRKATDPAVKGDLGMQLTRARLTMANELTGAGAPAADNVRAHEMAQLTRTNGTAADPVAAIDDLQKKLNEEKDPVAKESLGVELTLARLRRAHERGLI